MKKLKKIGLWCAKWILAPILMVIALVPTLIGLTSNLFWVAVKAGWNIGKQI